MVLQEERIQLILQKERTLKRWKYIIAIITLAVTLYLNYLSYPHLPTVVFILSLPYLCLEWRKTKLLLSFNEEARYTRWVRLEFSFLWFAYLIVLTIMSALSSEMIALNTALFTLCCVAATGVVLPYWIDNKLHKIDPEHPNSKVLEEAKEALIQQNSWTT